MRWISAEPLLGPIDLRAAADRAEWLTAAPGGVDLVITGSESGPGARECKAEWLRALRDQCAAADVYYFLKQAVADGIDVTEGNGSHRKGPGFGGPVIGAPYLDGRRHLELPQVRP